MEKALEKTLKTRFSKEALVAFIESHPEQFNEAINLARSSNSDLSWRAAWVLSHCMEDNDIRLTQYTDSFINALNGKKDGHQRELLKVILKMELNEEQEGKLFDICMNIWESVKKSSGLRFTAFRFLKDTAKKYPELNNELDFLTQDHYLESLSPGIKNAIERMKNN